MSRPAGIHNETEESECRRRHRWLPIDMDVAGGVGGAVASANAGAGAGAAELGRNGTMGIAVHFFDAATAVATPATVSVSNAAMPASHTSIPSSASASIPHTALASSRFVSLNVGDRVQVLEQYLSECGCDEESPGHNGEEKGRDGVEGEPSTRIPPVHQPQRPHHASQCLWLRGYVFHMQQSSPSQTLGIFPTSYVSLATPTATYQHASLASALVSASVLLPAPVNATLIPSESLNGNTDPLADDIAAALLSWSPRLKDYLLAQNYTLYESVNSLSLQLYKLRHQVLAPTLSREKLEKVKSLIVDILEYGNHIQGLDSIVRHRTRGYLLGEKPSSSMVKVFKTHFEVHERLRCLSLSAADHSSTLADYISLHNRTTGADRFTLSMTPLSMPNNSILDPDISLQSTQKRNETIQTYYIHFELSGCFALICSHGEYAELAFFLYNKHTGLSVSEDFTVLIDYTGIPVSKDGVGAPRLKTVFCEISEREVRGTSANSGLHAGGSADSIQTGAGATTPFTISSGCSLCLGVRIVRVGKLNAHDKDKDGDLVSGFVKNVVAKRASSESLIGEAFGRFSRKADRHHQHSSSNSVSKNSIGSGSVHSASSSLGDLNNAGYRRPFACGVLDLNQVWRTIQTAQLPSTSSVLASSLPVSAGTHTATNSISTGPSSLNGDADLFGQTPLVMEGTEHTIPLFSPTTETLFPVMHDQIFNQLPGIEASSRGEDHIKVVLNLSTHASNVSEPVPSSISISNTANKYQFQKSGKPQPPIESVITTTPRLGFPDRMHPHETRNSIYMTLVEGEFASTSRIASSAAAFVTSASGVGLRNVQVSVQFRLSDGTFVDECVSRGLHAMEHGYESVVYYHTNSPRWDETFRVDFEPQALEQVHALFLFRQCASITPANAAGERDKFGAGGGAATGAAVFAYTFLPLVGSNAVLPDQDHVLPLYKFDRQVLHNADYLHKDKSSSLTKDRLTVSTTLCSTLMTQSSGIMDLLYWRQAIAHFSETTVGAIVTQFVESVAPIEVVKFLNGIMDALIDALDWLDERSESPNSQPAGINETVKIIFNAIIHVCTIMLEPKFAAYESAMESYVDKFLRSTRCWKGLLTSFCSLLDRLDETPALCASVRVWGFWFQIAVRSGLLDEKRAATAAANDRTGSTKKSKFGDYLLGMMNKLEAFVGLPHEPATRAQQLILRNFMDLIPYLERVYGAPDLMPLLIRLVDGVNQQKNALFLYQLAFIHSLIRSPVFNDQKSRLTLVTATRGWVKNHLSLDANRTLDSTKLATARICASISAELIEKLHRIGDRLSKEQARAATGKSSLTSNNAKEQELMSRSDLFSACVAELSPLLDCFIGLYCTLLKHAHSIGLDFKAKAIVLSNPFRTELAEVAAVVMSFVHFLPVSDLIGLLNVSLDSYIGGSKVSGIGGLYIVLQSLMKGAAFPSNWANANMKISKVVVKTLRVVSEALKIQRFQTPGSVSAKEQLFLHDYFSIILQLLNSRWVATELFGPQLKRLALRLDTDVRGEAGELFRYTWKEVILAENVDLGSISFIRSLFGSFLELTMSPHPRLKLAAVELLFSILDHECKTNGNFQSLEAECWDRLEGLIMNDGKGDKSYRHFLVDELGKYFAEAVTSKSEEELTGTGSGASVNGSKFKVSSSAVSIDTTRAAASSFAATGAKFLKNADRLLEILFTLREIPQDASFNDERVWLSLKLIYFFRDVGRRGLYIRYIHRLADFHVSVENHVEAALTTKLHADLLPWSHEEMLDPIAEYGFNTTTSAFERKESLWMKCIKGLEVSGHWERAIILYAELAAQYEKRWYGYANYASLLRKQADLIDSIVSKERYYPTYYRVGFYGKGHAPHLQGKQFIYKAGAWEKLASFCESILNKFVTATILRSTSAPSEDIVNGNGSWIQITAVNPEIDRQRWTDGDINQAWYNWEYDGDRFADIDGGIRENSFESLQDADAAAKKSLSGVSKRRSSLMTSDNTNYIKFLMEPDLDPDMDSALSKSNQLLDSMPPPIRTYYQNNEISSFSCAVPYRKTSNAENSSSPLSSSIAAAEPSGGPQDPVKEFTELWTEKTLLITSHAFPCLAQRAQVIKSYTIQISPIENAIIAVRSKTRQLSSLLKEFQETSAASSQAPPETRNVNSFTMALNGAVDAPVNGGVPMYRRAFLGDFSAGFNGLYVKMLASSIDQQVGIVHSCLILHENIVGPQMRPLHASLISLFNKNFEKEIQKLGLSTLTASSSGEGVTPPVGLEMKGTLRRANSSAFLARIRDFPSSDHSSVSDAASVGSKLRGFFTNKQ
ncbi:hypothetical protein BJ741DRAFT_621879 [Chytriomyces cf. hyalinus JEL632]|nr:hypothetical protein BJ741DRAFT_621879 [Chytriomyces cf. hyalinus JEL632]